MGEMVPQEDHREMNAGAYRLGATRQYVRELYPVLLDAHGNVIDGYNRLDDDPSWRTETLSHIETPAQLWAARIIANSCRRDVSRSERRDQFAELARCLSEEGVPRDQVAAAVSRITTFSERYVQLLLPAEYKRTYNSDLRSQLESGRGERGLGSESGPGQEKSDLRSHLAHEGQFTVPAASRPGQGAAESGRPGPQGSGLLPRLPSGALASPEDSVAHTAPGSSGAAVAHDAGPGTPGPHVTAPGDSQPGAGAPGQPGPGEARDAALRYVQEYHERHPEPDAEYLVWEAAIKFGVSERTAQELVDQVRRERGAAEARHAARARVTCPLCRQGGADRAAILGRAQDPRTGQMTLQQFVLEAMA